MLDWARVDELSEADLEFLIALEDASYPADEKASAEQIRMRARDACRIVHRSTHMHGTDSAVNVRPRFGRTLHS